VRGSVRFGDETFSAHLVVVDGRSKLKLRGEFDMAGVLVDAAVEHLRPDVDAVLDVADLMFVDSGGLRRLLQLRQRVAANGGVVVLERPQAQTLRLLDLSGTLSAFVLDHGT
jgi:anti-anti-sigma factor